MAIKTDPSKMTVEELRAALQDSKPGIIKNAALWPDAAPGLDIVDGLITKSGSAQLAYAAAKAAADVTRKELYGDNGAKGEMTTAYRLVRDTVRTYFGDQTQAFGIPARTAPSRSMEGPEPPQGFRVVTWYETGVRVKWKPVRGRPVYEVFLATGSPEEEDRMVGTTTSSRIRIFDLKPGQEYYVRVRAKSTVNTGPKSDPFLLSMPHRNLITRSR